jgi:hypothetical protein
VILDDNHVNRQIFLSFFGNSSERTKRGKVIPITSNEVNDGVTITLRFTDVFSFEESKDIKTLVHLRVSFNNFNTTYNYDQKSSHTDYIQLSIQVQFNKPTL